jgi:hypothetical protein
MTELPDSLAPSDPPAETDLARVVYTYDPARNPDGGYLPGVPLRDLTAADLADLPAHLIKSLPTLPGYSAVDGPAAPRSGRRVSTPKKEG